jgi:predicted DNA-binding ribbon-helix-helix protein
MDEGTILHMTKRRMAKWIDHILRRNRLLIASLIESYKEREDEEGNLSSYWKLKEEALDCTLWITRFVTGYGFAVKQTR